MEGGEQAIFNGRMRGADDRANGTEGGRACGRGCGGTGCGRARHALRCRLIVSDLMSLPATKQRDEYCGHELLV